MTSRSLFLHFHFEKDLPMMSAQKSCRESLIPGPSLCPLLLLLRNVGLWSLSLISHVYPLRSKTTALTDDRIRTMSEVITGIRTIKMYAWGHSSIYRPYYQIEKVSFYTYHTIFLYFSPYFYWLKLEVLRSFQMKMNLNTMNSTPHMWQEG